RRWPPRSLPVASRPTRHPLTAARFASLRIRGRLVTHAILLNSTVQNSLRPWGAVGMAEGPYNGVVGALWECLSGGVLLSHTLSSAVPSALGGLASGFGMCPGVSLSLWPP